MEAAFKDKICVITGAASGLGLAMIHRLLAAGAVVIGGDVSRKNLEEAQQELTEYADQAALYPVDVREPDQVKELVAHAVERGRLDYLFNNAGIYQMAPFEEITREEWQAMIDINVWGVINGMQAAIPIMLEQGGGHIVNTNSQAGFFPMALNTSYCLTKYAVLGLSQAAYYEYADRNIVVSAICPSDFQTNLVRNSSVQGVDLNGPVMSSEAYRMLPTADDVARAVLEGVLKKQRIIQPMDNLDILGDELIYQTKENTIMDRWLAETAGQRLAAWRK